MASDIPNAVSLRSIIPFASNAKRHTSYQIAQIARSIEAFGFNQPIVLDKDNVIIVGHGRYLAAKELGLDVVPVLVLDRLTPEQVAAYRLADNKLNESEWDMALAIEELRDLDQRGFDITLTGFTKDLLIESDERDDQIPTDVPAVAKVGDLWQLGRHRVLCGDSTVGEDVARLMDGKKAAMVFTDPPYNVNYHGGGGHKRSGIANDSMTDEKFREFLDGAISNLVSHVQGALYICMGDSQIHSLMAAFRAAGGAFKSWIIWEKHHFVLGGKDYHSQSELILHGTPDEYDTSDGDFIMYGFLKHEWYGGRKQGNVWHFDKPNASALHPTMKPVMLCAKAITNSSKQEEIVLDTFLGSGSTLIAAEKTGRICYGMEVDPKYVDVIIKRWEDYTNGKANKVG